MRVPKQYFVYFYDTGFKKLKEKQKDENVAVKKSLPKRGYLMILKADQILQQQ